ncbi:MAG TPA: ROK family protein [Gemmatimonadaceae bacterium]|nr:ROK family protein [Gemmatimonadaceae bacterium]
MSRTALADRRAMEQFVGVDIGGTAVKLGICSGAGSVLARSTVAFERAARPDDMLDRIAAAVGALVANAGTVRACGVGIPGELDAERRSLRSAINLPEWKDVAIPRLLSSRIGIPVVVENDGNCAAWGESRAGAGRGVRTLALFTLGTGVGGGIVLDGELWTGAGGAAGALGHLVIDPAGPICGCGQRGCLQQFASATAISRRFGGGSAEAAFEAAHRGDADGTAAIAEACEALAIAAADVIHMLQPDLLVLGGGLTGAGDNLLVPVRERVRRHVRATWLEHTRIELAALGGDAGWIGAALFAGHSVSATS